MERIKGFLKRAISFALAASMLLGNVPMSVFATEIAGEEVVETTVPETGVVTACDHSYEAVITDSICTEQGYTTYTCECGDEYVADFVDATGHREGEFICSACGTVNSEGYISYDEAVTELRAGLVARQSSVEVKVVSDVQLNQNDCIELYSRAIAHTGVPNEGDYIRYNTSGRAYAMEEIVADGKYYYDFSYTPLWLSTAEQEAEVDAAVAQIMDELNLWDADEYEKIVGVYNWVTENVDYDLDNLDDAGYMLKHSTYSAVIDRVTVCQGFASLLYRMMLTVGVDCRLITGTADYESHGWNIVKLGDVYYNVDATWDRSLMGHYRYFLIPQDNFSTHVRNSEYDTAKFHEQYPMAKIPYVQNVTASGNVNGRIQWVLDGDTGTLSVVGTGAIPSYRFSKAPWYQYRESVKSIVVGEGITEVGERAFYWCTNCTSVTLPESLTAVREYGFNNLRALQQITLPGNLKIIEFCAFSECSALKSITIPDSVTTIGSNAFSNCPSLKTATLGKGMGYIPDSMFGSDTNLTTVIFQEGLTKICDTAFMFTGLTSVELPASVTEIGVGAFSGCTKLKSITVAEGSKHFKDIDGVLFTADGKTLLSYPSGRYGSYTIPEGTEYFDYSAFRSARGLSGITFPSTLKEIGEYAFMDCTYIRSVTIPANVTRIGENAFRGCASLTNVTFQNDSVVLDYGAFSDCDNLSNITLPAKLKAIPGGLFFDCGRLTGVTIPDTVTSIGTSAFMNCDSMTSITIPGSVKKIEQQAFDNCNRLASITIQEGVQRLEWIAIRENPVLRTVNIPSSVTYIHDDCFSGCPNIRIAVNCGTYGCNYVQRKGLAYSLTHSYTETVKEPTCAEGGFTTYTCPACGDAYTGDYVAALGHYVLRPGVEYLDPYTLHNSTTYPFVISNGWYASTNKSNNSSSTFRIDADYDCTMVLKYKVSSEQNYDRLEILVNGNTEVTVSGEVSERAITLNLKTGDVVSITYSKDSSVSNGADTGYFKIGSCTLIEVEGLVRIPAEMVEPTCTEAVICESCNATIKEALGHTWDAGTVTKEPTEETEGTKLFTCERCGETREETLPKLDHVHAYTSVVTEPTCTERGYTTHTCQCGDSFVDTYVDALGHNMGEWAVAKEATCTEDGEKRRDCSRCDYFETEVIEAAGHNYEVVVTAPTCTTGGYTTHTCQCGDSFVDTYVDALGHNMGEWIVIEEATCTEDGSKRRDCSRCDHFETEVIEATGHAYESVVTDPTCTERGYTTHTCSCGDSYVDTYIDALGHDMGEWAVTKEATCTEDGSKRRDCSRCDYFETEVIEAAGHAYESVVTDPTCTERGYTTHTCQCGDGFVDTYVDALGHNMGEWAVTKEATCTEDGSKRRDCSRCDYFETETIEAAGHNYEAVVTKPTCTEKGYTTHTCSCGDSYVDSYVDPLPLPEAEVAVARMILGNELAMQFAFPKENIDEGVNYVVSVTKTYADGRADKNILVPQSEWKTNGPYYYVSFNGIAAKEMGDTINVQILTAEGVTVGDVYVDSIREYALRQLRKATEDKICTLYVDMLNYGAAAQTYFKYDAENLVTDGLTPEEMAYGTKEVKLENNLVKGPGYGASQLNLASSIQLRVKFNGIDSSMYAIVKFTNHMGREIEARVEGSEFMYSGTVVVIDDVVAADYDRDVTITVYDADGKAVASAVESVASYIARMSGGAEIYSAVAKYCAAAYGYLHK